LEKKKNSRSSEPLEETLYLSFNPGPSTKSTKPGKTHTFGTLDE